MEELKTLLGLISEYWAVVEAILLSWLTAEEWKGMGWVFAAVFLITEYIKRNFIDSKMPKMKRKALISSIGLLIAMVASFIKWPDASTTPWYFFGVIAGPAVNFIHLGVIVIIRWKWPGLAAAMTGDKRKENKPEEIPEEGERRQR